MRPTWIEIDLNAVSFNIRTVRNIIGDKVRVAAVVKADAYGHGAVPVSKVLSDEGVDMFCVATMEEALEIRESGIKEPILLLGGVEPEDCEDVLDLNFIPAVYTFSILSHMEKVAKKKKKKFPYHLKIDTGMGRLGFRYDELTKLFARLDSFSNIEMQGVFTHLATADSRDLTFMQSQLNEFDIVLRSLKKHNYNPSYIHVANSAAIQRFKKTVGNMVRPGIMIYGACAMNGTELMPVMKVKSRIIQLKNLPSGTPISYGGNYTTKRDSLVAVVPIGYADGYVRSLSSNSYVSIKRKRAPVVGDVCMDFIMVDVTDIRGVEVGEEVVLFGDDVVSIEDVSKWAGTIPYEILTLTGKRMRRCFIR